jgi:hypothetical protein
VAEVEIHAHPHEGDEFGKRVGIAVGIIGIVLSVVTILSHREHTAAVVQQTKANDSWAYYQAKKIREYSATAAIRTVEALGTDAGKVKATTDTLAAEHDKFVSDAAALEQDATSKQEESEHSEVRALYYDIGEGFLELGLVLSSLYFLARKRLFPALGGVAALLGAVVAAIGMLPWAWLSLLFRAH